MHKHTYGERVSGYAKEDGERMQDKVEEVEGNNTLALPNRSSGQCIRYVGVGREGKEEKRMGMVQRFFLRFRGVGTTRPKADRLTPDNFYLGTEKPEKAAQVCKYTP
jgi:hypothetical protein